MDSIKKLFAGLLVFIGAASAASAQDAFDPQTSFDSVNTAVNNGLSTVIPLALGIFAVTFLIRLIYKWMGKARS